MIYLHLCKIFESRESEPNSGDDADILLKSKTKIVTQPPSMYKVFLLNDDYTPMDFVVEILEVIFAKSYQEAITIMLHVHRKGIGLCGVYTYDVAETKVSQVMQAARAAEHPLQCKMEKE
ncbi:MAG: ATP-dependent Clp protease adapter ClpS [Proteobacteria bacterium]|jgi:ATP-dependent Clp protease adaptor protein ClpS|nr:ATP-dependent Clp protease adapter ClpS [Alphaproteobacteria bacterium]NCC03282.1 ATP-dependent Clp protease adapter ClpS [Pseudomonadota bacterium]